MIVAFIAVWLIVGIVLFATILRDPDRMNRQRARLGLPEISPTALKAGGVMAALFLVALAVLALVS